MDVVIYGYSSDGILESFLLDTYPIHDHSTDTFKNIGMQTIKAMKDHNCKVRAFVTDGMPAQKAAYDPTNKHSIQYSEGGTNRNIFFVYCRCHLINRVIEELIEKTP